ncbi:MAG: hypothetical protein LBT97_03275 [Planctomycetota bacterium]|jgi:hypothetical protein|nr:hypothetical protein [Planctomycetota bacterium]
MDKKFDSGAELEKHVRDDVRNAVMSNRSGYDSVPASVNFDVRCAVNDGVTKAVLFDGGIRDPSLAVGERIREENYEAV